MAIPGYERLFIVPESSGADEDATPEGMLAQMPNLRRSGTATTRPLRPNEHEGVNHRFISDPEFDHWLDKDRFLKWVRAFDCRYGTPRTGYREIARIDPQRAVAVCEQVNELPVTHQLAVALSESLAWPMRLALPMGNTYCALWIRIKRFQ